MILHEKNALRSRRLETFLPVVLFTLSGPWFFPASAPAQKASGGSPGPSVTPTPTPAVALAPGAAPSPGLALAPPTATPLPAAGVTPDPLDPGAALPLDASTPGLAPLITGSPLGGPAAPPRPSLPAATVSHLDDEYNTAVAAQIPVGPHEGQPISLLQAVRSTLSNNPQIQLSSQDAVLSRAFLQQNTGVFDSRVLVNASKERDSNERTPAQIRADNQSRKMKALLGAQFLSAAARLQADLDRSKATNTLPQEDYSTGGSSSVGSQNGVLSNSTVAFLDQGQQNLANAQKQQQDAFTSLITQIATQNATPAQLAQLQALQQQNVSLEQQSEQSFITAFQKIGTDLTNSARTLTATAQVNNFASYSAGVSKLFRNGVTVEPSVSWSQQDAGSGPPVNRGRVGVLLNIPFLRNAGVDATGAPERAAHIDFEASQLSVRHTVALSVFQTAQLYWGVVAAQRRVDLLRQSQQVATTLLDLSAKLVDADELARADIFIIAARTNDTAIQVYSAELALLDAQQQLAVQIGEDPDKLVTPLSPSDGFLPAEPPEAIRRIPREGLLRTADGRRADLAAARKLQLSGKVLARAAQINLKPLLNVALNVSWSAIDDGSHYEQYVHAFTTSYTGPSFSGAVTFDWPVANNTQRGLYNQARATLQQRNISTVELQRAIASGVVFSLGSVENALQQLQEALRARTNYRKSLDAQYAKLKAGNSTFLDAVQTEILYTSTGLNVISAQFQYATALARVRYETGTILPPAADALVNFDDLTTIPVPAVVPITAPRPKVLAPVLTAKTGGR